MPIIITKIRGKITGGKSMISKIKGIPADDIKQNAQQWMQSAEGQKTIQDTLQESKDITTRLQEERRVDLKSLHEPFTV